MEQAHKHLASWAIAKGYSVAVYGHGEFEGIWVDYGDIVNEIELNDCGYLELLKPNGNGEYCYNVNSKGCYEALATFYFENGLEVKPDGRITGFGHTTTTTLAVEWRQDYETTKEEAA